MRTALTLGCALLLATVSAAAPEPPPAPEHMDVSDSTLTCAGCHADFTPEIHSAWYAGAHGLNSVQCFVCHGSTTERFAVEVPTERCAACHGAQVDSMAELARWSGMEDATCFSCHPPHRLSPHMLSATPSEPEGSGEEEGGSS